MTRFNKKTVGTKVINRAGGAAFSQTAELELVSLLLTSFVSDKFYESSDDQLTRLQNLVAAIPDKKFIGQAAIYARTQFGMRSITHALIGELVNQVKGQEWLKNAVQKTIFRPDDMMEMVSYYFNKYGKPMPNSLKKGIRASFNEFDPYELAKYRGENLEVKLVDLVNLVHPKPNAKNKVAFKQLVAGKLKSKDTWEKNLTQAGQKAETEEEKQELKGAAWAKLIKQDKLGYFALLRNLRNIIQDAPEVIDEALAILVDKKRIKNSLVLPFRFITALDEISKLNGTEARKTIKALNVAVDIAADNVPKFPGMTLVALDCSGSMSGRPAQIGSLFAAILSKSNEADIMLFSDDAHYKMVNTADSTITIANSIGFASGGTNFPAIFAEANRKYDRIIILSDMQGWVEGGAPTYGFEQYRKKYSANPKIFSIDLAGHGDMMFPQNNVYCLAGFSEKIFGVMKLLEEDRNALVETIKKIVV